MKYNIIGGTVVSPESILKNTSLTIEDDRIVNIGTLDPNADFAIHLDQNNIIFPGLINSHDHLLGSYYPRVGYGPYMNWFPWDNDLKSSPLYEERGKISNADLYLLGVYKNIISGVTTVQDHIPHEVHNSFIDHLPIRIVKNFNMMHECSSFDLKWGYSIREEHEQAVKNNFPFITHIQEGYDEETTMGVDILLEMNALDEYTVLIHGVSFNEKDIKHIAEHKANVVWCPTSNYFMFKDTTNIQSLLKHKVNVCLGTDSPMSGGLNILEEMQFSYALYDQLYNKKLSYKTIVEMVTTAAARALRLEKLGKISIGNLADLTIIRNGDPNDPYQSLVKSWLSDIRMVISNGLPLYGLKDDYNIFKHFKKHYQLIEINGDERILIGQPINLYKRIWKSLQYKKILPFFPIDFYE